MAAYPWRAGHVNPRDLNIVRLLSRLNVLTLHSATLGLSLRCRRE